MSNRDEQLEALEAAVKSAESKLKNAEMSVKDVERKMKSADEAFEQKLAEKAAGYKEQTGVDFSRTVDENGRVTYSFSREATEKEQKKRRSLTIKRQFDSETGKVRYKAELTDNGSQTAAVNSAKDFHKPKNRKRYISFNFFGYRKLELSTEVNNPFLNTVGKPIIVPIQAAARLVDKKEEFAKKVSESSVGRGVSDAAKIVSAPIVIPAKIVKDIADKGGVIHSVVDLGSKIKIEGVNAPKPLKSAGNVVKNAALTAETGAVETAKGIGKFSIEIAKEKIYEEVHKGISENEATQAAYVIGIRAIDVYQILHEHTKYKKAVRRDKAGNDITDVNISRYLADKEERKFQNQKDSLNEQKSVAEFSVDKAREEYEAALSRLEKYQKSKEVQQEQKADDEFAKNQAREDDESAKSEAKNNKKSPIPEPVKAAVEEKITNSTPKKDSDEKSLSKTDKEIKKVKGQLSSIQEHRYRLRRQSVFNKETEKTTSKLVLKREEVTSTTPATVWQTKKKIEGLAIRDTAMSMRRKAMRDGGDNSGVEAANFGVTATRSAYQFMKFANDKERQWTERHYQQKLQKLNNQKRLEESNKKKQPSESNSSRVEKSKTTSENKKKNQKKRNQKKVYKRKKQERQVFQSIINDVKNFVFRRIKGVGMLLAIIAVIILLPVLSLTMCGGGTSIQSGMGTATAMLISPCDTVDLGLCDLYYTELAKNMIDVHQNIENYYIDYDKYVCLTEINEISHSPEKLLPCVAVNTLSGSGEDEWNFEQAKPYIEDIFNEQYEFYTNEIHEVRKNVTTVTYSNENSYYSAFGTSEYNLERPEGAAIPNPLKSEYYTGYAHTYTHVEVPIINGYIENTLDCIGVYTDENGYTTEYDEMQTMTFYNLWQITLVFDYMDNGEYQEYWKYTEQRQEYFEYDYYILEYAIRENQIDVPEDYWTETDWQWQDNNFDKLIYNRVLGMNEEEQELFDGYFEFNMGHQELKSPYTDAQVAKYPGYNNDIYGDMSLENSIVLYSTAGQEILCGMDGEITVTDNGFSVYNEKFGTLYYDGTAAPNLSTGAKGVPVSTAIGDTLKITFIDNEGNYINPLFIFSD